MIILSKLNLGWIRLLLKEYYSLFDDSLRMIVSYIFIWNKGIFYFAKYQCGIFTYWRNEGKEELPLGISETNHSSSNYQL